MMLLFSGKKKAKDGESPGEYEAPVKLVATSWTRGQLLSATVAKAVVWVLLLAGPLSLALSYAAMRSAARPAPPAVTSVEEHPGERTAAALAGDAVVTWLRADRSHESEVQAVGLPTGQLPGKGLDVSDPSVVATLWVDGAWSVTVAVTVTTSVQAEDEKQPPVVSTQRRYFQVPVVVDQAGTGRLASLPAEVAGPAVQPLLASQVYRTRVPSTEPSAQAATEFLAALLTGAGDITRFTAPGGNIRAVTPAPYSEIQVQSAFAANEPPPATDEGQDLDLMVRVRAQDATGSQTQLDYLLSLSPRAGRWEVVALKPTPLIDDVAAPDTSTTPPSAASSEPQPSATPTK